MRRAVERLEIPWPVADRLRARGLGHLRQPGLAGALPVGPASTTLHSMHYGEGAYVETEREIQALLGVSREPVAPVRPEDAAGRADRARRPRTSRAPTPARTRRAACGSVVEGSGVAARQRRASCAVTEPGCVALIEHARHTRGELALEVGDGVTVHATCFTPGRGLSSSWPRSPSRRTSRGGPSSSTITAVPGQYGEPFGLRREEVRLVDPRAGVDDARAGRRVHSAGRRSATGRSGASGPRSRARRGCRGARSPRGCRVR